MRLGKRPLHSVTWRVVAAVRGSCAAGGRCAGGWVVVGALLWRCGCGDGSEEDRCGAGPPRGAGSRPESSHHGPSLGEWSLPSAHAPRKGTTTPGGVRGSLHHLE